MKQYSFQFVQQSRPVARLPPRLPHVVFLCKAVGTEMAVSCKMFSAGELISVKISTHSSAIYQT